MARRSANISASSVFAVAARPGSSPARAATLMPSALADELRAIGINLNQIAHVANAVGDMRRVGSWRTTSIVGEGAMSRVIALRWFRASSSAKGLPASPTMCWARAGVPATIICRPGRRAASHALAARISGSRLKTARMSTLPAASWNSTRLTRASRTRRCEKDAVHLMLAWRVGDTPTREQMEAAAQGALKALGMEDAKAFWVAHRDEDHAHLHIVASKIHPETGRAYDLKSDHFKLSKWAEQYERENGGIVCLRRQEANGLRDAIDARDPAAVLEALTRQRATFTAADLERALGKQIPAPMERAQFGGAILDHAEVVRLADSLGGPTTRYTTRSVLAA